MRTRSRSIYWTAKMRNMRTVTDLPGRLRRETAELHQEVEVAVGLPDTVRTRHDYGALLGRLHAFHASIEDQLAASRWTLHWSQVGIDLADHRRADLAQSDGVALGCAADPPRAPSLHLESFGEALGCLYVMEGSSLGGGVLAPAIRAALGDVPTRFYDSDGRNHPQPWRAVQVALRRYQTEREDVDDVVDGARQTFGAFGRHLASRLWSTA